MTSYVIFGGGMMGEAIAFDLLEFSTESILIIEQQPERAEFLRTRFSSSSERLEVQSLSLGDHDDEIKTILQDASLAFGAIDYKFNRKLTEFCIETKTHFLDLGGNPDVVSSQYELNELAQHAGVTIIPDCGLAPGMVNVIAGGLIKTFDRVDECHLRVGGLPQVPTGILKYQQVFSIRGLTNEYKEDAIVLRKGKIEPIPSMTELEDLYFPDPFGRMEAFQTAGGTSSLPRLFENKISELTYKTIRYPGHMQYFRFLLDFDLLSDTPLPSGITPREVIEEKLVAKLPRNQPDVVLIRILLHGIHNGTRKSVQWQVIDYMDEKNKITSMGRTTAYPISIIGQMIVNGTIIERGVVPGELVVPLDDFESDLHKRSIAFSKIVEDLS